MGATALLIVIAYLLGSVSCAVVIARLGGLSDPRTIGSGNPGATNMLRAHGQRAGIVTLLGDIAKGLLPVLIARYLDATPATIAAVGLAAFLGHLFPVFFNFRGGKGVATFIGVVLGWDWRFAAVFAVTWLLVAGLTRYSSLAALLATGVIPLFALSLDVAPAWLAALLVMVGLIFFRHRNNIEKLRNGTESRIGHRAG